MTNIFDIIIVGGGPAGSIAAHSAASRGVTVLVLEKDRDIGYPVRCGEAISKRSLIKFIEPDKKFIRAEINKFSLTAPDKTEVTIEFDDSGFVLERRVFDYELAKKASQAGAIFQTRSYVNGLIFDNDKPCGVTYLKDGEVYKVFSKVIIGADGVESRIGRWAGLRTYCDFRDMESCFQITASNIQINQDTCYFYLGREVAPEGYLWAFPKGDSSANIGLGVSGLIGKKKSANEYLENFMSDHFPNASRLTEVAGGVPCCVTLEKISSAGIMLVGDAARQVNPLSGGGIASGMTAGRIAGEIAAFSILNNKPDHLFNYEKAWADELGKKHLIYDKLKKAVYNFDDDRFNNIAKSFSKIPQNKRSLGKLFATALINNPMLLVDVAKVFI